MATEFFFLGRVKKEKKETMGASSSRISATQEVENINNVTANVLISANQGCSTGQSISQNIKIGDLDGVNGLTIEENATQVTNLVCLSELDASVSLSTEVSNAINSSLKATASAGQTIGYSSTDVETANINKNINDIANNVSVASVQTCIAEQFAEQNVDIGNIKNSSNITITIVSSQNAIVNCLQKQKTVVASVTDLANTVTASSENSATSGFDLGAILGVVIAIIIVIALVFFLLTTALPATILKSVFGIASGVVSGVGSGVGAVISTASTPEMQEVPKKQ